MTSKRNKQRQNSVTAHQTSRRSDSHRFVLVLSLLSMFTSCISLHVGNMAPFNNMPNWSFVVRVCGEDAEVQTTVTGSA